MKEQAVTLILSLVILIVSLAVYTATVSTSIVGGDSTEMATAVLTLGVPHQPSYPLYVVVGHMLTKFVFLGKFAV